VATSNKLRLMDGMVEIVSVGGSRIDEGVLYVSNTSVVQVSFLLPSSKSSPNETMLIVAATATAESFGAFGGAVGDCLDHHHHLGLGIASSSSSPSS
jgi:hypothetical protein